MIFIVFLLILSIKEKIVYINEFHDSELFEEF